MQDRPPPPAEVPAFVTTVGESKRCDNFLYTSDQGVDSALGHFDFREVRLGRLLRSHAVAPNAVVTFVRKAPGSGRDSQGHAEGSQRPIGNRSDSRQRLPSQTGWPFAKGRFAGQQERSQSPLSVDIHRLPHRDNQPATPRHPARNWRRTTRIVAEPSSGMGRAEPKRWHEQVDSQRLGGPACRWPVLRVERPLLKARAVAARARRIIRAGGTDRG